MIQTDNRCPACNRPVKGRVEILERKPMLPASECQYCKTPISLTFQKQEPGFIPVYYYETKENA